MANLEDMDFEDIGGVSDDSFDEQIDDTRNEINDGPNNTNKKNVRGRILFGKNSYLLPLLKNIAILTLLKNLRMITPVIESANGTMEVLKV